MIATNPVVRSVAVVYLFWYISLFLFSGFRGVAPWHVVSHLGFSIATIVAGVVLGAGLVLITRGLTGSMLEKAIKGGSRFRDAHVMLGGMPPPPTAPRARVPAEFWKSHPWWPKVQAAYPAHAAAIRAVVEVLHTQPSMPASPVPGGHGGRTLLAHSLGVASEMITQAKGWVYEGQKDKRGKIRVPLQGPPHSFGSEDIGLLILTGLAHDIGKLTCYEITGTDEKGRPVVAEMRHDHDSMGARLLRQLPEVMALPYADRTALILAVGYYHHAYALPIATWATDRMRSLTELLVVADTATGQKEGGVMVPPRADQADADHLDDSPEPEKPVEERWVELTDDAVEEEQAAVSEFSFPGEDDPEDDTSSQSEISPKELEEFMRLMRKPSSVNGQIKAKRIAIKSEGRLYVIEEALRRHMSTASFIDALAQASGELDPTDNAPAPLIERLLGQLDARGMLIRRFDGTELPADRAIFKAKLTASGQPTSVILLEARSVPGLESVSDQAAPALLGPLYSQAGRSAPAAASPPQEHEDPSLPADEAAELAERLPEALCDILRSEDWTAPFSYKETADKTLVLVDTDSAGGEVINSILSRYQALGVDVSAVLVAKRAGSTGQVYAWPLVGDPIPIPAEAPTSS